jgi:hypothetical protein
MMKIELLCNDKLHSVGAFAEGREKIAPVEGEDRVEGGSIDVDGFRICSNSVNACEKRRHMTIEVLEVRDKGGGGQWRGDMIQSGCGEGGKIFHEGFVEKFGKKTSDGEMIYNRVGMKGEGGRCDGDKTSSVRKSGSTLCL